MAPIDINNQEIDSITLNGNTDIDTVEVDGQTVFSAGPTLPVAYSNLVAWYPFDSATYGGSNADDVTAILGGSGDDTAYDGTVSGANYQSSGGVTDIDAGANSGAFSANSDGFILLPVAVGNLFNGNETLSIWVKYTSDIDDTVLAFFDNTNVRINNNVFRVYDTGSSTAVNLPSTSLNTWNFYTFVNDNGTIKSYANGSLIDTANFGTFYQDPNRDNNLMGNGSNSPSFNGFIDDVRIYNTALSGSQINQIYQNTNPN